MWYTLFKDIGKQWMTKHSRYFPFYVEINCVGSGIVSAYKSIVGSSTLVFAFTSEEELMVKLAEWAEKDCPVE